jgi:membrane protein
MSVSQTGRRVVQLFREKDVPFMAASIAYYAVASFIPLLLVSLALLSLFGAREALVEMLRSVLSPSGTEVLNSVLTNMGGHGIAGGLGFLLALWSGIKVFRGLSIAFDEIYTRESDLSLLGEVKNSVLVLGALLGGFIFLSAMSVALTFVTFSIPYPTVVGNVLAVLVLVLVFLPMFYILPPVSVTVRHTLPGTVLAAVGWVALQVGFFYYAGSAGKYAAYGLLGALLMFITFLYIGAIILLVGVVLNVALAQ